MFGISNEWVPKCVSTMVVTEVLKETRAAVGSKDRSGATLDLWLAWGLAVIKTMLRVSESMNRCKGMRECKCADAEARK